MADLTLAPFGWGQNGGRPGSVNLVDLGGGEQYIFAPNPGNLQQGHLFKTLNDGVTWDQAASVSTVTAVVHSAVWFDKWTPGDTGTRIHIAYMDISTDDLFYRYYDTATGTLGAAVTVFTGATFNIGATSEISIVKAVGGNIYIAYDGDGGTEKGFYRSTDNGGTFGARTDWTEGADYWVMLPGNYADTNDIDIIFWDRTADEISLKTYDDSADSTSETSISTGMTDQTATTSNPQFSAIVRHSDGHIILVAWNSRDVATADMKCWDINGSGSITGMTDVITNADDCHTCALVIDQTTDDLYVAYLGKSDGSETYGTSLSVCRKSSTDGGSTWSAETVLVGPPALSTSAIAIMGPQSINTAPSMWAVAYGRSSLVIEVPTGGGGGGGAAQLVNTSGLVG